MENVEVLRPDTRAALVLFLLVVCVPALVVVLANVYAKGGAGYRVPAAIVEVLLVTFAVLLVFMQRADFGVADGVLTVRSSFYEVKVPLADVEGEPTIVDLAQHPERGRRSGPTVSACRATTPAGMSAPTSAGSSRQSRGRASCRSG